MKIQVEIDTHKQERYVANIPCSHCEGRLILRSERDYRTSQAIRAATGDLGWVVYCSQCEQRFLFMSDHQGELISYSPVSYADVRMMVDRGEAIRAKREIENQEKRVKEARDAKKLRGG